MPANQFLGISAYEPLSSGLMNVRLQSFRDLSLHHYQNCPKYQRIIDAMHGGVKSMKFDALENLPFLPSAVFKQTSMCSVKEQDIKLTLTSSGTTGSKLSNIYVDAETSRIQQIALANCMSAVLGKKRLPMLIADTQSTISDPRKITARGAGILGLMRFGSRATFIADHDLNPNVDVVKEFLHKYGNAPFFIFGFTFMVWKTLVECFSDHELDLSNGILVHSGGWKQMSEQAVDNASFRSTLKDQFGLTRIYNFYGMVEQLGSLHMEGNGELLYPPCFSEVIIRDETSWEPLPPGQPGLIQVLSLLPLSYPGHAILTEDIGVQERGRSMGGKSSVGLRVLGRVKKAELRGCSDVIAAGV